MARTVEERYKFKPFIGSSHAWALERVRALAQNARILDFGAGAGCIGEALKALGYDQIYAVELDRSVHPRLNSIYKEVSESVDSLQQPQFDVLLVMDVLEHVPNPEALLNELIKKISPGGSIILSLPNVGHWSARLALLFGRFTEFERGILDRTHLHFYTRRTFHKFLAKFENVHISQTYASISPAELALPKIFCDNPIWSWLSELRLKLATKFPSLLAYQHLALLVKR